MERSTDEFGGRLGRLEVKLAELQRSNRARKKDVLGAYVDVGVPHPG